MEIKSRYILAVLSVVSLLITTTAVVLHQRSLSSMNDFNGRSSSSLDLAGSGGSNPDASLLSASRTLLMTGVNPVPPELKEIPLIRAVPWERSEVVREYTRAGAGLSCSLLEPSVEVVQSLVSSSPGVRGPLGRQTMITISLQIDPLAKATLPKATRGAIEDYLENHQVAIQLVMYHEKDGAPFFGPQTRAAFIDRRKPELTTAPENLIVSALAELRTLGVYVPGKGPLLPAEARTMILAFRYTRQSSEDSTVGAPPSAEKDFELIFVHNVVTDSSKPPRFAIFATSKGRAEISLLDEVDPQMVSQSSIIAAHVKFDDFTMLGMYPATPIVTGVYHQAQLSIPVSSFRSMMDGVGVGGARELPIVLDELYERSAAAAAESVDVNRAADTDHRPTENESGTKDAGTEAETPKAE
jgi:hypothetical protein